MTAFEIRQSFMDFFKSKDHEILPSSPVVLPTDPTLMFTNAGMNQFKDIFLGARESQDKRVANTQKCIRVSGKHNDLEEVGVDTYHHTFFEMLGNWSFGDYYKEEAIVWAWELMTGVWGLPKDRLWATVHHTDDEAEALWWSATDIPKDHVQRFGDKDNFWEMGETGPCGPCSEIHIDLTADGNGGALVNADSPDVMELWNLVFIQNNRKSDGSLDELPSKHVDTGMGLERIVSVLQGKKSNYDSDLFMPIINLVKDITGKPYGGDDAIAMRVIADHVRTLSIAISDGVLPSNEGRGYVLRRLLRRAVRYGRKIDLNDPFLGRLFPVVEDVLGDTFPELSQQRETVLRYLQAEEESFAETLDRGLSLFEGVIEETKNAGGNVFPGEEAFKLYDTYGFPDDLTALMASEQGLTFDKDGFDKLMTEQKKRARSARSDGGMAKEMDLVSELTAKGIRSDFKGYEQDATEAKVVALSFDGVACETLEEGQEGTVMLSETPFYAESGGQLGDVGTLTGPNGTFEVADTQKPADGIIFHVGKVTSGTVGLADEVKAEINADRRGHLRKHHTATHLLNFALHEVLGGNIKQAGSMVAPDRLRFDFTHYEAVSADKIEQVEQIVNEHVIRDDAVETYAMAFKDVPGSGITAVFDEKYGDEVRVVDVAGYSRELCGGTHVGRTGEIGFFRVVNESSVAAGIRRIEAVCGHSAFDVARREKAMIRDLSQRFSVSTDELVDRVEQLADQNKKLEKELKKLAEASAQAQAGNLLDEFRDVDGVNLLAAVVDGVDMDGLRTMMDDLRQKMASGVLVLGSAAGGKAQFVAAVTDDLVKKGIQAGKLIGQVAKIAGGGGGGRPDKAQAGGKDPSKVPEAIAQVEAIVKGMVG